MSRGRLVIWLLFISLLLTLRIGWEWPDNRIQVTMCQVGQGDAILITQGFNQVLIDGGPDSSSVLNCLRQVMPFWDREINLVVATHDESDHISGLPEVIRRYRVQTVLVSPLKNHTDISRELEKTIKASTARPVVAKAGMRLQIGSLHLDVLSPTGLTDVPLNEASVVLQLSSGHATVLLSGDISGKTENELVETQNLSRVKVLKVAHHGSASSTSERWVKTLRPEIALISVGENNRYGHPNDSVLKLLESQGVRIYRTDKDGTVTLTLE